MVGNKPVATWNRNDFNLMGATQYKSALDGNAAVAERIVDVFAPHELPIPAMKVMLDTGHLFNGTTLTEIGNSYVLGDATGGSPVLTNLTSTAGLVIGQQLVVLNGSSSNFPSGALIVSIDSATQITVSVNALFNDSGIELAFFPVTGSISAPVGNPRIDRVVIDNLTGAVSVVTGTPAASPTAPAIPAGKSPVAQVLLQTSSTAIANDMITDERSFGQLGVGGTYAPLASPAFTGNPTAPTPSNGDSDTSLATTAFVQNALGTASLPGGRLTLTSGAPVMNADDAAATSVYYTPYVGASIPIFDGTSFNLKAFSELTLALDSDSGHTGYHQSGKNFDLFVVNDAGTMRLGTGSAWSTDTSRGTGGGTTELQRVNGIWTNKVTMTLRFGSSSGNTVSVDANEATYVGTMRATANGQTAMVFKPSATAGGNGNVLGLCNAYNRVATRAMSRDSTASWTYGTATWRAANNNNNNRVSFIDGLQLASIRASHEATSSTSGPAAVVGVNLDSTSATPGKASQSGNTNGTPITVQEVFSPQLGFHYVQAMEYSTGATSTFFGVANSQQVQGLIVELEM